MKEALRLAALLAGMSGLLSASSTKTMLNGGQFGVATAAAAFLCKKHNTTRAGCTSSTWRSCKTSSSSAANTPTT